MDNTFLLLLVGWLLVGGVFGLAASTIWQRKGGGKANGFLIGFLFGVLGLILVAVMTPPSTTRVPDVQMCPRCTKTIGSEASVCPFCGYELMPKQVQ